MKLLGNIYNAQFQMQRWLLGKYYGIRRSPTDDVGPNFAPTKILFVLGGLLGDSVMCLPTITAAKSLWKDAHITLLGKKHNYELVAACPYIDDFYICQADPLSWRGKKEINKLQKWLGESKFDLAVILLSDQFACLLAEAKIPIRVGVKGDALESCLTHAYEIGSPHSWSANERLNSLRVLGYQVSKESPQLCVEEEARKTGRNKLSALGLGDDEKYVVLHPFGSTPQKWWNMESVAPLARQLYEKYNMRVVLVGKKYDLNGVVVDPPTDEEIDSVVINTTGKLTLPELLAVIDDSASVITTDSGPFHIAGALNKPTIGLFRSLRPEHARHYRTAEVIFGASESCLEECSGGCCQSNLCRQLSNISPEAVVEKVGDQLQLKVKN